MRIPLVQQVAVHVRPKAFYHSHGNVAYQLDLHIAHKHAKHPCKTFVRWFVAEGSSSTSLLLHPRQI